MIKRETVIDQRVAEHGYYASYSSFTTGTVRFGGHTHAGIEILYIRRGYMEFSTASARHVVPFGSIVVCAGEIPHVSRTLVDGYDPLVLHVLPDMASKALLTRIEASASLAKPLVFPRDCRVESEFEESLKSSRSITDVARAVGFASARGLQTAFRRIKGVPPSDFQLNPIRHSF